MKNWFSRPFAKFLIAFVTSLVLYVLLLGMTMRWLRAGVFGPEKYFIAVLPMLPTLGVPIAAVCYCRTLDELELRKQLESVTFGFMVTAIVTFTYGFLQYAGLPDVNWVWVWPVMGVSWLVGRAVAWLRYR